MIRLLTLALFLFSVAMPAMAQSGDPYAGINRRDLIERSIETSSQLERAAIRVYVAEHYPETGEGYFARAWIADRNGAGDDEIIGLYRKATSLVPDLSTAWINLGYQLANAKRYDEAVAAYEKCLDIDPVDPFAIRNIFFTVKDNLKDKARADKFLATSESRGLSRRYIYDYVRGIEAQVAGKGREAEAFFERSLKAGDRPEFGVLQRLSNLRLDRLDRSGASNDEKFQAIRDVLDFGKQYKNAAAFNYAAEQMKERFRAYKQALSIYETSYATDPTPEAAIDGFAAMGNYDFNRSYGLLEQAARDFPQIWEIRNQLAWANYNFAFNTDLAEKYSRDSLKLAKLAPDIATSLRDYGTFYEQIGRFDDARDVYLSKLDALPDAQRRSVTSYLVLNRIYAQDYDAAASYLAAMEKMPNVSGSWVSQRRERINAAAALENERKAFLAANPFLRNWEKNIGSSLTLAIEFETNSDVIRPETLPELDKAAAVLNAPGGEKYVFLIEGNTDSRGSDEINMPLSQRRAEAAARYLEEHHGIPASRLRTVGYGPRQPIATNETETGRQRNRRVEIRPYGNVSDPQIAVTSALDATALAASPDGRLGAVGYEPVQLWDLHQQVKIRDLYRGSSTRAFSPNGRYLATTSNYREVSGGRTYVLYVYDTKTGLAVGQIHAENEINRFGWSPFSDELAYTDNNGFVRIYNVAERKIRAVNRMSTQRIGGPIVWLADGDRIAVGQFQHQGVKIYSARDLTFERTVDGVNWPHRMGQTRDGRYLVAIDNSRVMAIWDTRDWREVSRMRSPVIPNRIVSHPSRPWVLMNDTFNSKTGLVLVDLEKGDILNAREAPQDLGITFSPDGNSFSAGASEHIEWYDTRTLSPISEMTGLSPRGKGLTLNTRDGYVTSRDSSGSYVWDLATGRRLQPLRTSTERGWRRLSKDGATQYTISTDNDLVVFNADDFQEEKKAHIDFDVTYLTQSDRYILLLGRPEGSGDKSTKAILELRDRQSLQVISSTRFDIVTQSLSYDAVYGSFFSGVAISDKEGLVGVTTAWKDGYGHDYTYSRVTRLFDVRSGDEVKSITNGKPLNNLRFNEDDPSRIEMLEVGGGWRGYDARSGRYIGWEPATSVWTLKLDNGQKIEWSRDMMRLGDRSVFFGGTLASISADESRNLLLALTSSNELIYFDLRSFERQLTLLVKNDDEWIAYAPSGEFTSSLNGTKGVFWSLGDNYLPFEALKSRFERPRIIQDRLSRLIKGGGGNDQPVPVEPEKPDVDPDLFNVPYKVSLDSPAKATVDGDEYVLRLRVEKSSADLPDPAFEYSLNGRVVIRTRGFDEEPVYDGGEIVGIDRKFKLREGENVIEASLVYKDARVLTQRAEINRKVKAQPKVRKTTQLWYFGVGISKYEISSQDLEFAHKDALDLEKTFKAQEGVLYGKVNTKVLVNDQATERDIRVEMNDFLRQASAEDVIVLFIAGHGVQDNEQRLYLVTYDGDKTRPYTGMQVDKFRDFLSGRPINQKAIFLMDICHSGAVGPRKRGGISNEEAVQALSDGTGTIVLASSTGAQLSQEDASFGGGHGAFTAALLEGLNGKADADAGDQNGYTSVQELISYTSRRVPQMTNGEQHPTVPNSSNVLDFPISAVN
nr:OmpA family protein [uncultured Cohaesibacter sp.]